MESTKYARLQTAPTADFDVLQHPQNRNQFPHKRMRQVNRFMGVEQQPFSARSLSEHGVHKRKKRAKARDYIADPEDRPKSMRNSGWRHKTHNEKPNFFTRHASCGSFLFGF
jgi:hypothetical protein